MKSVPPSLCRSLLRKSIGLFGAAIFIFTALAAEQTPAASSKTPVASPPGANTSAEPAKAAPGPGVQRYPPALVQKGSAIFQQNCSFCHGHDAGGGESGPDLTRSRLVATDKGGDKIGPVVRNGRPDLGMPPFHLPDPQIAALVAFIQTQRMNSEALKGGRKGVDPSDLQTGNLEAGRAYFNGAGQCSTCHSPTGDLAGIAQRYQGLQLEMRMLYPRKTKSKVTVTPPTGEPITGELAYLDEFTVGLTDASGRYHSWPVAKVQYKVDAPVEAHADLLSKYTDDDIHNLMAYLQSLR